MGFLIYLIELYFHVKSLVMARWLRWAGYNVLSTRTEIESLVRKRYQVTDDSICHVLGSGWSLNQSVRSINPDDFVIGFNQSALAGTKLDLYFVEFGGARVDVESQQQINLVNNYVSKKTNLIIFKNIWESKNDFWYIYKNWSKSVFMMRDHVLICRKKSDIVRKVQTLLAPMQQVPRQLISTAITSVALAEYFGFKKIVLHGVDFGGKYFYETSDFSGVQGFEFSSWRRKYFHSGDGVPHQTATGGCSLQSILPVLRDYLDAKAVKLYAASPSSPSSIILPVYKP